MASIRQVAQEYLEVARDGIGYIALWKDGKGWMAADFWPDIDEDGNARFDADVDKFCTEQLENIVKLDPNAIIVNGWVHNLGSLDEMTRDSLAGFLRWQYDLGHFTVADFLEGLVHSDENSETTGTGSETSDQQNEQKTVYQVQWKADSTGGDWSTYSMSNHQYNATEELEEARWRLQEAKEWHNELSIKAQYRIIKIKVEIEEVE